MTQADDSHGHGVSEPWFTGKSGTVLLYRVNRRPRAMQTLGAEQPALVMDHILEVLSFGQSVTAGRRSNARDWILGNQTLSEDRTVLSGQIGWHRVNERATDEFDPATKRWRDSVEPSAASARAPFVFHSPSRYLGVLKHPSFSETTIAQVFETLLKQGEERREWPSTEWAVEPILDETDFLNWLRSVQSVQRVSLVAKMPNPDGLDEFGSVWQEMERHKARLLKQTMEAANREEGLIDIEQDERVKAHIAMSSHGFGYVTAKGQRDGHESVYDQRQKVARENTEELSPSWIEAAQSVLDVLRRRHVRRSASQRGAPTARLKRRNESSPRSIEQGGADEPQP